jgi:hypothetical protein
MPALASPSGPLHPMLEVANVGWGKASNFMKWFTKVIKYAYTYTDMIIAYRQKKVDTRYKFEEAEKAAFKVLDEQNKAHAAIQGMKQLRKRSGEEPEELGEGMETDNESLDLDELAEFLEDLYAEFLDEVAKGLAKVEEAGKKES